MLKVDVRRRVLRAFSGLLAVGACGRVYSKYKREADQAQKRVSNSSQIAHTHCGVIEYAIIGDGPPVLVVHGAGGGYDQSLEFGRILADRGFRVIAMSRFGYLGTPLPLDASTSAQADAYACLLDALNIRRAAIIGVSAGALSSMQFALRHPHRCNAMVLLVPAVYVPRPGGEPSVKASFWAKLLLSISFRSNFLYWAAIRLIPSMIIRSIFATPPAVVKNASRSERARVRKALEIILPVRARKEGLANDAAIISSLQPYELEQIATPSLLISAADDLYGTLDSARYTAEHLPHARLVAYPRGGHLWVGHDSEVVSELDAFIKKHPA